MSLDVSLKGESLRDRFDGYDFGSMAEEEQFQNHSEIVQRFVFMRDGVEALWNKINELRNEVSEHEQVLKALEPMEVSRKCYWLVGDVLVERTVGEIIPAVQQNEQGLEEVPKITWLRFA